ELAQAQILVQQTAIFLAREPPRIPGPVDAEAKPDRVDLLTHLVLLLFALAHDDGQIGEIFLDLRGAAPAARVEALQGEGAPDRRLLDIELVDVELVVVLGVGALAADHLRHEIELARADAQRPGISRGLAVGQAALGGWLAHDVGALTRTAFLSAEWPWKVRVGANSPSLWPIMCSVTSTGMNLWPL